ncbi:(Glutamate--ammonia-ligase) adenylyltransferase [Thermodesulfatator indicus DSM 15286]|uniref:(Glutamate--ammonia-ligase) adenylyltransferase n=1 Tax=Thermodesulfatator indicus (strain DSM 15286 / JCM 11887 / CIR29812) TaxID=667014 RepID=F8ADY1_THEID|nr:[glutamate--ammonia-ligase] adenylyltransferase [Thermodesulfatator indicus]AEH44946.1 (Glutamate--ammonia-ligase) adenylyltransferase [Thermodesulfatator indicus DSM 15286]
MQVNFKCLEPPDSEWASFNLERLKEAHSDFPWGRIPHENLSLLKNLLGFSPYATNILLRRKDVLELFCSYPLPKPKGSRNLFREIAQKTDSLKDWKDLAVFLRRIKQREMIKILAHDLAGREFRKTVFAITALAEASLKAILFWLTSTSYPEDFREKFFILGMGKFGARELNYSSDIDIIYFFHAPLNEKERFIALAREITRIMDTLIEGDRVFRVDLGLRPGGKDGELVYSARAGVNYYFYQAHPFERLAMVKARPVAGNIKLGKSFLKVLRPVIYPQFLDFAYLEHIKDLKARIEKEARKKGAERNIKIGPGGIRSVEFFCQTLQMIFGGKHPYLRTRHTLWALNHLAKYKILPSDEALFLKKAYVFLRQVEHRIQTVHFRQTYTLPEEETSLKRLAKSLGYQGEEAHRIFLDELNVLRQQTERIFLSLLEPEKSKASNLSGKIDLFFDGEISSKELAGELNLPSHLLKDIKNILVAKGPLAARRAPLLKDIFKVVLEKAVIWGVKTETLAKLLSFFERLGGRLSFYHALRHDPEKIEDLLEIFEKSAFLSHLLMEVPGAAEALFELEISFILPVIPSGMELEQALGLLRMAKNEEIFRVAYLDLKQKIPFPQVPERLSILAESIIKETYNLASSSKQYPPHLLTILGLGKLGGKELGYRSDLDMVFIAPSEEEMVPATKLVQRFMHYLTTPLPEGPGYEVDTRLRPEGRKGPLVATVEGFLKYHQEDSGLWEKLALLRLKPLAGDLEAGELLLKRLREVLSSFEFGASQAEEIRQMRFKMEKERTTPGRFNPKVSRGGLADIEFVTFWLILKNIREKDLWGGPIPLVLNKLAQKGIVPSKVAKKLEANYLFLRRLEQLLILLLDKSGEEKEYSFSEIKLCESYLGSGLEEKLKQICEENRKLFEEWLA